MLFCPLRGMKHEANISHFWKYSDAELIGRILLGIEGSRSELLGSRIIRELDRVQDATKLLERVAHIPGVGETRANLILGAIELGRRLTIAPRQSVSKPEELLPYLDRYAGEQQEYFLLALLNGAHELIDLPVISIGLVNRTLVHPREVFAPAIAERATAIIVAHNHPSGDLTPSEADRGITSRLAEAGKLLGIELLDHIIFGRSREFYSFSREQEDCLKTAFD